MTSTEENANAEMPTPSAIVLAAAAPNPFNPRTELSFELADDVEVSLRVFDLRGRCVAILAGGRLVAGRHRVTWTGTDAHGRALPSGTYLARLETEMAVRTQKLMLVR